ncbi:glycosyltransferase family 1 protein [Rossellomorea aquimaris]|jgi:glycosyltransferase involved in cell wall biosynthesis|uniref:Glycosyltransferase family 1 protein n=1 Tax=Rossellomorea aquimaris TaxID=189382 RepID=A0A5D4UJ90_9BACI|nr:glycosyltransferase family 1 protein [Rossellomorea aquimaris]TYS77442.1 glycosyltransferase family 1 protein [Rossellomorea aquimaris]TYS86623.1 glycosyltransferase family 1 protein [Rossellomorea aquimaris]TYS87406.1 glycosyltransferase family 1 protein [Rossellomorea aquimaris]
MRVALFSDTYYPQVNGVARTLKRLTNHYEKRGIEYKVFAPDLQEKKESYPNVHSFTSFPFFFYPECRTAIANPKTIEKQLKDFSPTLIHVTTPLTMGLYGVRGAKKMNIPLVASYHTHFDLYLNYYKMMWVAPLLWKYMKWFYSQADRIFVPSIETKLHLENQGFTDLSIWSRGVDCQTYSPEKRSPELRRKFNKNKKYTLLYVGRLAPEKDLDTLEKTIKYLPQTLKDQVQWVIVGDGPMRNELMEKTKNENVLFTGYVTGNELAEVYASSDLFVFPSASETFGNVVLEAFASGLPAVVADKGGVTNIVVHNQTGRMAKAHRYSSFIHHIEEILNRDLLTEMKKNALQMAEKQSWDCIFDQLITEFHEVSFLNSRNQMSG